MEHIYRVPSNDEPSTAQIDADLLRRGVRLNSILLGTIMGVGSGLALFFFTHLSLLVTGEDAGRYLNLLGVFFPGYSASPEGAWIGLLWGFVAGAVSGGFIHYLYARSLGAKLAATVVLGSSQEQPAELPVLRISGHGLGLALGSLAALQLFLSTLWLVLRGTADQSPNAALLANYLPGYSVSFVGGLIGAADMFVFTYVLSLVLAGIYNLVVSLEYRAGSR